VVAMLAIGAGGDAEGAGIGGCAWAGVWVGDGAAGGTGDWLAPRDGRGEADGIFSWDVAGRGCADAVPNAWTGF
jgi:hypothetical protein